MVNNSTLVYVLENLEDKSDEIFNLEEVLEIENSQIQRLFEVVDKGIKEVSPEVVERILRTASFL